MSRFSIAGLLLACGLACHPVLAQENVAFSNEDAGVRTTAAVGPYFRITSTDSATDWLPLKRTRTRVAISGVVADVTVTQTYANRGTAPINASYIFPGSTRAAVTGMTMTIGDRVVRAQIKEKEAAKQAFEAARRSGRNASLLQQQRPNVFSMDVANILPGDTIDVELHYIELITATDGVYEFVYPGVVGPRYAGADAIGDPDQAWVSNPYLKAGEPDPAGFDFALTIDTPVPLQDLQSPSHRIDTAFSGDSSAGIAIRSDEPSPGNKDFILRYRLQQSEIISGLMRFEGGEDGEDSEAGDNTFLLLAEPPARVRPEQILPRDYVFIVDVSGSMAGFPLDTSKTLLRELIGRLKPTDSFNILFFAGGANLLAPAPLPATPANLRRAVAMVDGQRGGGGTELKSAMDRALALPNPEDKVRSLVVLTDGYINAERRVFQSIRDNLGTANIFAFGIGRSVNRYLIEGLAKAGNGELFVATDDSQAEAMVDKLIDYIEAPVLTDIAINARDVELTDLEPTVLPDMLAQRPLLVLGKYRVTGPNPAITVSGQGGNGGYVQQFAFSPDNVSPRNTALPLLWARKRIEGLSDVYLGDPAENRDAIVGLGLRYSLLTRFTSFVAVDDIVRHTGKAKDVKQPLPLPEGVPNSAVGATRTVPEPPLSWLAGLLVLLWLAKRGWAHGRLHLG